MKSNLLMDFYVDKKNKKISVEREFSAPISKVWSAWTESEKLDKWWAPKPWKAKTKSMDFREGGFWLYAMVGPDGEEVWGRNDYKSIKPLKSFSGQDAFCDSEGNIKDDFPKSNWKIEFRKDLDSTIVSIESSYDKLSDLEKVMEMGFKEGFTAALENLDKLLNQK